MSPQLRHRYLVASILLFLEAAALPSTLAAQPYRVDDLNRGSMAEDVDLGFLRADTGRQVVYFAGSDPAHGVELWRTDGTPSGTVRLTDVCPGPCGSNPTWPESFGGRLFFGADDGVSGREPWTSDGTPGGEHRVRDICPGPCGSDASRFLDAGDAVLFLATSGGRRQLWRTTGPRTGTGAVADLCPVSPESGGECASPLYRLGNLALFFAHTQDGDTSGGVDLWRSDGTPGGTQTMRSLVAGLPRIYSLPVPAGSFAFFWTLDELWRTDGTAAGTRKVRAFRDVLPGRPIPYWTGELVWNGVLYAIASNDVLVRSDGTPEGTTRILDFAGPSQAAHPVGATIEGAIAAGLLLSTGDGAGHGSLWRSGGSAATTERLFYSGDAAGELGYVQDVAGLGDRAVFRVRRLATPTMEVWVTDGTTAGTRLLAAFGQEQPFPGFVSISTGRQALFLGGLFHPGELWHSDGTSAGTGLVRDFAAEPGSSGPLAQIALPAGLLISGQISRTEAPLFLAQGDPAAISAVSEGASWAAGFARLGGSGGSALFSASEGHLSPDGLFRYFTSKGLWRSDGTPAGTAPLTSQIYGYRPVAALGRSLLFAAGFEAGFRGDGVDVELWRSDGTPSGTAPLKDIDPFHHDPGGDGSCQPDSSRPGPGVMVGGRLVFAADDGKNGREPWVSDGTRAGTRLLADLDPARREPEPLAPRPCDTPRPPATIGAGSDPRDFVPLRATVLFTADDGRRGRELWRTDGVAAPAGSTRLVKDLRPGAAGSAPHDLVSYRDSVYFIASAGGAGEALWRSDGTARGTVRVHDLLWKGNTSWARELTVVNGVLFFAAYNEILGAELWSSRGDAASTAPVVDLRLGPLGSYPQRLADAGGVLVFAATDGSSGLEPWRSDGTPAGTFRLGDLNPGLDASAPGPFTRVGPSLFFGAFEPEHGRELWAAPSPP